MESNFGKNKSSTQQPACDIILIQPPAYGTFSPPLGIASLVSYLRLNQLITKAIDYNIEFYNKTFKQKPEAWKFTSAMDIWTNEELYTKNFKSDFIKYAQRIVPDIIKNNTNVVGISVLETAILPTIDLIEIIQKFFNNDIKIILGGASMDVERATQFINNHGVYCVFQGEAEVGLTEILMRLRNEKLPSLENISGLIYKINDQIVNNERANVPNLGQLPFPDFTDFNLDQYGYKEKVLPIITTRGCIANCTFCGETNQVSKFRQVPIKRIVDEIENNIKLYGVTTFRLNDSLVNGNLKALEGWVDEIIQRKIKINFGAAQARIDDRMSSDLFNKLSAAGCKLIQYGVESGSDRLLKIYKKGITSNEAYKVIVKTKKAGIAIQVNIIVGHFEETIVDYLKTIFFLFKVRKYIDYINLNVYGFDKQSYDYSHSNNIINKYSERWSCKKPLNNYFLRKLKKNLIAILMNLLHIKVA